MTGPCAPYSRARCRAGTLVLAGAPLGRPGGRQPAAAGRAGGGADVIAAEDTRRLRRLAADLGVTVARPGRVASTTRNEEAGPPGLLDALRAGRTCCWSPTPACPRCPTPATGWWPPRSAAGVPVTAVPGPSAVTTALAVSGLPVRPVLLRGLPAAQGRRAAPARWPSWPPSGARMVFFEAPHRLAAHARRPGRRVRRRPAGRGLPGADQDLRGGPPGHAGRAGRAGRPTSVRGEITLVVAGAPRRRPPTPIRPRWPRAVAAREAAGPSRARRRSPRSPARPGLPKRVVYDAVVAGKPRSYSRLGAHDH